MRDTIHVTTIPALSLQVWRANLKRDASLLAGGAEGGGGGGGDPQAVEAHLREAYKDALR